MCFFGKCFLILGEGAMEMSGDRMMSPDGKPKVDVKDDSSPPNEPHKPKVTLDLFPFFHLSLRSPLTLSFVCFLFFCFHFIFFDLAPLMKQTRSDPRMLPQHSGLLFCCFLAIFNDLFNIYHS